MSAAQRTLDLMRAAEARQAAGDLPGAAEFYRAAIALEPKNAILHYNLGAMLLKLDRLNEAGTAFGESAQLDPRWVKVWEALGQVLFRLGRYVESAQMYEAAIARDADRVEAICNAAVAWRMAGSLDKALAHVERARHLSPANDDAWAEMRATLILLGRREDALADFLRYEATAPRTARSIVAGLAASRQLGDRGREARYLDLALRHDFQPGQESFLSELLSLIQYFDVPPEKMLALYSTYDRLMSAANPARLGASGLRRDADPRIRVGYLSADFRGHIMGALMLAPLARHDHARFLVHAYSLAPRGSEDASTARWRAAADRFRDLTPLPDRVAAEVIANDDLDLLVDLMGHTGFARPGIHALKPARVIATHLGYHGALGLSQVDFKITDRIADTADSVRWQLEAPLPLDVCVLPMRRVASAATPLATREALGIPADAIVFGAFVPAQKLSPRCLDLWRRILDRVPGALLAFSAFRETDRIDLARRVPGFGIPPERVVQIPGRAGDDAANRTRYTLIDVTLDTMPYSGGDTTTASLDAGVPVVTLAGSRHAERMSASILGHLGLSELVTTSEHDYAELAVRLAQDGAFRAEVRERIAAAVARREATDPERYVRALEDAYVRALSAKGMLPGAA